MVTGRVLRTTFSPQFVGGWGLGSGIGVGTCELRVSYFSLGIFLGLLGAFFDSSLAGLFMVVGLLSQARGRSEYGGVRVDSPLDLDIDPGLTRY